MRRARLLAVLLALTAPGCLAICHDRGHPSMARWIFFPIDTAFSTGQLCDGTCCQGQEADLECACSPTCPACTCYRQAGER